MPMNYEILLSFMLATAVLAISPGPDNIYVLIQSISNGKKYGLATVSGLMTGCTIHTTLVAFGVSAIIKQSDLLFLILKIAGAGYLFFLAFKVWKSESSIRISDKKEDKKSLSALFWQGFMMNLLNPKVAIFFLAFFPGFLFSKTLHTVTQFYVLGGLFILISFLIFATIALLAGHITEYLKKYKNTGVVLKWLQITVFVGIGIFILFSEK